MSRRGGARGLVARPAAGNGDWQWRRRGVALHTTQAVVPATAALREASKVDMCSLLASHDVPAPAVAVRGRPQGRKPAHGAAQAMASCTADSTPSRPPARQGDLGAPRGRGMGTVARRGIWADR